LKMFR